MTLFNDFFFPGQSTIIHESAMMHEQLMTEFSFLGLKLIEG